MKKKILFIGVFTPYHSNNNLQKIAFEKAGYEVEVFDYRQEIEKIRSSIANRFSRFFFILKKFPSLLRRLFYYEPAKLSVKKMLLEKVKSSKNDLIFLSKTEELDYKIIDKLNEYASTFYYFMDPPSTAKTIEAYEYAKRATYSSATFSDVVNMFKKSGGNSKQILEGILPPDKKYENKKNIDVVFVGTLDKKRKNFIKYLKDNNINIVSYGPGTKKGPIYGDDLFKTYAESKIILNLTRIGDGFSLRIMEAMKSGSLMLSEYSKDLEKYFCRKEDLDWFESKEECLSKIKYYLNNKKEREFIANNGYNKVIKNHTWDNQIKQILKHSKLEK